MARRYEHGALRAQPARRKDQPSYTVPEPIRGRDTRGRFQKGNRAAQGRALKALIKRHLGSDATTEEVEQLYKDTLRQFRALLVDLPASDAHEVQDLIARRARWSVLSARYAAKAAEVGLFTPQGAKLVETALKLDARAERLAVSARDEAEKISRSRRDANPQAAADAARALFARKGAAGGS